MSIAIRKYYSILAVDTQAFSKRRSRDQALLRAKLREIVMSALSETFGSSDAEDVKTADTGDGLILLLPDSWDAQKLTLVFRHAVESSLIDHNHSASAAQRLRIRMVYHLGRVSVDPDGGFTGTAVVHACRLLDTSFLRSAIEANDPRYPVALAISDRFYQDVIIEDLSLYRGDFHKEKDRIKNRTFVGWLYAPKSQIVGSAQDPPRPRGARKARARAFPRLREDVKKAGAIALEVRDGQTYEFRLFSVGERGTSLDPQLVLEVERGLVEEINNLDGPFDYVIAVEQAGVRWALLVTRRLNKVLKIVTTQLSDSDPQRQVVVPQRGGFYPDRDLYFPRLNRGDRVIVIDDVISSGATIKAVMTGLKQSGVEVLGIFCIIDKTGASLQIEKEEEVPVRSLLRVQ